MPVLKYEDADGVFHRLSVLARGEQGDKGDKGDKGDPGNVGPLDSLTDVTGTTGAAAGKLLGTTGAGAWGPVDPPAAPDLTPYATRTYVDSATAPLASKTYVDSRIWSGTQAQYDAIPTKDPSVLYVVV